MIFLIIRDSYIPSFNTVPPVDNTPEAQSARSELTDDLVKRGVPKEAAESYLNSLAQAELEELKRLRELNNNERENQLLLLEQQLRQRDETFDKMKRELEMMVERKKSPNINEAGESAPLVPLNRSLSPQERSGHVARGDYSTPSTSVAPTTGGGVFGGAETGGGASIGGGVGSVSSPQVGGGSSGGVSGNGNVSSGAILITANSAIKADGEINQQASQELLNYLNQKLLDLNSLNQIKQNGMVLEYPGADGRLVKKIIPFDQIDDKVKAIIDSQIRIHEIPRERLDQEIAQAQ
jgi:hypothetical protein